MIFFRLFAEFFLIGLFAVGGGMASIPFLQDLSERTGWFSLAQLSDMIAVSEVTPGPIGVNLATYTGYVIEGLPGVIVATAGLVLPSVIIILIVSKILKSFRQSPAVDGAFYGIRPASCALLCTAVLTILRLALFKPDFDWRALALLLLLLPPVMKTKLNPLVFLAISAVAGVIIKL